MNGDTRKVDDEGLCFWVAQRFSAAIGARLGIRLQPLRLRSCPAFYFCVGFPGACAGVAGCVFTGCEVIPCNTDFGPVCREA